MIPPLKVHSQTLYDSSIQITQSNVIWFLH